MKPKTSKEALKRRVFELEASLASNIALADKDLRDMPDMMGSGVILSVTALGGKELCRPVMIADGLSSDTIEAIRRDLVRSYKLATMLKPKGAE